MLQGAAFKFIYIGYAGELLNFLSVYFLSLNAVLGPTLTHYKSHYKNNNNKKNNSYCILTTNTQFRIENNTWVQVDMEFFFQDWKSF